MQTAEVVPEPQFAGSEEEQQFAREVFRLMRASGRFFPVSAPIRTSLESLVAYFASRHPDRPAEEWPAVLDRALTLNEQVFLREETESGVIFATTAAGRAPEQRVEVDASHTLARRFEEPVPLPERPAEAEERPSVEEEAISEPEAVTAASTAPVVEAEEAVVEPAVEPVPDAEVETVVEVPVPEAAPEAPVADIASMSTAELADLIAEELRHDLSVANFGDLWMIEDKVPRLSRGDLRRIREYILERNEPLTDEELLQDVLGTRPGADDYELMRFALNFRLSREQREFEFVGTSDRRLWSTTGLPTIGTSKRKASELGQDYRFLLEYRPAEPNREETVVEHVLTFYEYQYGVLPYDGIFEGLLPPPVLPDQRAAVLAFESPQLYETFLVELRYPTGNRGGYLVGFEKFFQENLVPGALITIERSENNGRYLIEYLPISGQDRRLLQLDEKKNRYVFRPTTFYCATQENMVLSENRFPRLANTTPLDERTRRRPEEVLAITFERIGENVGSTDAPRYMAILDDLVAAANLDRPMTPELIRDIVASPNYPQFSPDPDVEDVFYFEPRTE